MTQEKREQLAHCQKLIEEIHAMLVMARCGN